MRAVILAAVLVVSASKAFAGEPTTMEMPMADMNAIHQFFLHPPLRDHIDPGDVMEFIQAIENCAQVQIPVNGVIRSHGQCPAVSDELAAQAADLAKAKKTAR